MKACCSTKIVGVCTLQPGSKILRLADDGRAAVESGVITLWIIQCQSNGELPTVSRHALYKRNYTSAFCLYVPVRTRHVRAVVLPGCTYVHPPFAKAREANESENEEFIGKLSRQSQHVSERANTSERRLLAERVKLVKEKKKKKRRNEFVIWGKILACLKKNFKYNSSSRAKRRRASYIYHPVNPFTFRGWNILRFLTRIN